MTRITVHPRVCGENAWVLILSTALVCRFTPACAGKTRRKWRSAGAPEGFTPACAGKTLRFLVFCPGWLGSPPRVRGKRLWAASARVALSVHPRVCGENGARIQESGNRAGSPPRVRGKLEYEPDSIVAQAVHPRVCGENASSETKECTVIRFTPACAGKTYGYAIAD